MAAINLLPGVKLHQYETINSSNRRTSSFFELHGEWEDDTIPFGRGVA